MARFRLPVRLVSLALLLTGGVATAETPGTVIAVPSPVTESVVKQARAQLATLKPGPGGERPVALFDFTPRDKPASTPEDGSSAAADLASLIQERPDVLTVAYFRHKVSGHTVLPAVVCAEIVVGAGGSLGDVVAAGEAPLPQRRKDQYVDVVGKARPAYLAVVQKMYDRQVQLRRGQRGPATWYVDRRDPPAGVEIVNTAPLPGAADGAIGLFTAGQMRDLGLATGTAETRAQVAESYKLPAGAGREGEINGRPPIGFRLSIRGAIDGGTRDSVTRTVTEAVRNGATVIVIQLEAAGGDLQAARDLADRLAEIAEKDSVRIVAFVPDHAPDTAAVVALGCSEIVMSRRTDSPPGADGEPVEADFGNFETATGEQALAGNAEFWRKSLRDLAEKQGYPPVLVEGFVNKSLGIQLAHPVGNAPAKRLVSDEEMNQQAGQLVAVKRVKAAGQYLVLSANQAEEYRLARYTTATREPTEVFAKYGLDPGKVRDAAPAWLDRLAAFLKIPSVTLILVVVGFLGLMLEMKVPGTAVPGIAAALCFILIFWAHTQFSGQVAVLAGLLFVLGLVLVMLEVFVLPGFGVPGILGVVLILGSLGLVTFGSANGPLPSTATDWIRFGGKMAQFMFAMIAALALAFFLVRYLPNIPYANRLALAPPEEGLGRDDVPGAAQAASLLGAVGMTVTVLRPAGTVRLGEDFVDVVSEGGYLPAGSRVQVVEIEGNRVVVREV